MPDQAEWRITPLANSYLNWFNFLYIENELLYIQKPVDSGNSCPPPQVCVPRSMQKELVELAHAGHRGIIGTWKNCKPEHIFQEQMI